jgi:isocitrate dehydrogenase
LVRELTFHPEDTLAWQPQRSHPRAAPGARIVPQPVELGEAVFRRGESSGIAPEARETLRKARTPRRKSLLGVDVFVHWKPGRTEDLAVRLRDAADDRLPLRMITNRGVKVWPQGLPGTFLTDHWRCRFQPEGEGLEIKHSDVIALLSRLESVGIDFIKTEHLCAFDGVPAFSLGQGQ